MMIEMVNTIRGPVPRVALDVERKVISDNEDQTTVQVIYRLDGDVVRQDGHVTYKRWPEGMRLFQGGVGAGGEG